MYGGVCMGVGVCAGMVMGELARARVYVIYLCICMDCLVIGDMDYMEVHVECVYRHVR